jgi:hypothetical protein
MPANVDTLSFLGLLLLIVGSVLYFYPATVNLRKYDAISAVYYHEKWGIWLKIGGILFAILEFVFFFVLVNYLGMGKFGVVLIPFGIACTGLISLSYLTAGRNRIAKYTHLPMVICYCLFTAIGAGLLGFGLQEEYPLFSVINYLIIGFYSFYMPISILHTKQVYWAGYVHALIHYPWYIALFALVLK